LSYINKQDLLDELGESKLIQLTDNTRSGVVDSSRVAKAISYAVGTFDSYARTRYTLPVPATEKVKSVCLDLAVFNLIKGRATYDEGVYKVRRDAHDDAMKFLQALQSGKAALDIPAAEETAVLPASPDTVLRSNSSTIFTDTKLSRY